MKELLKYRNHYFDDFGGVVSPDYTTFETKYINYLKRVCKRNKWLFVKANRNHYCFSAVIQRDDGQYIYISISDVRHFNNAWYKTILFRTMKHSTDWTGGTNNHCILDELESCLKKVK